MAQPPDRLVPQLSLGGQIPFSVLNNTICETFEERKNHAANGLTINGSKLNRICIELSFDNFETKYLSKSK